MSKKIVIYTAVFGNNNYDALSSNLPGFDFICFTDKKKESSTWKIKLVKADLSPEVLNRKYKILAHKYLKKYDVSLYIDANIKILKNPKNNSENVSLWLCVLSVLRVLKCTTCFLSRLKL
jgi:hypothetical protein